MDNSNFEQQFKQNLKTPVETVPVATTANSSKLPLVIAIALAAITLVESIVLLITLSNYFAVTNEEPADWDIASEEEVDSGVYTYDDNYNLTAFNLKCTAEDGSYYTLDTDNQYEEHNAADAIVASGPYSITNDSLVSLSGSNKVLYYDGFDIADGLTIYTCEEVITESDAE